MNLSREQLIRLSSEHGFRPEILEKVLRLMSLLNAFKKHRFLSDRFVLKGGTALNAFLFNLPRLSADIDLNYVGETDAQRMKQERPALERAIEAVCRRENLQVQIKPTGHLGGKWHLRYKSALGGSSNLELDISFGYRTPLYPVPKRDSFILGDFCAEDISVLDIHELAAGKLAALLARDAARDAFDVWKMFEEYDFDEERLRVGFVAYGGMNRKDWRTVSADDISYDGVKLKNELAPFLRHTEASALTIEQCDEIVSRCREIIKELLPFRENEREFLDLLLDEGELKPELLSDDEGLQERIAAQPMLQWKAMNVRKHRRGENADEV